MEGSEKKNNDAAQEVQAKPAKSPEEKRKDYYESRFGWDVNSEEGAKNLRQLQLDYVEGEVNTSSRDLRHSIILDLPLLLPWMSILGVVLSTSLCSINYGYRFH